MAKSARAGGGLIRGPRLYQIAVDWKRNLNSCPAACASSEEVGWPLLRGLRIGVLAAFARLWELRS
jgi:hypothetical protein